MAAPIIAAVIKGAAKKAPKKKGKGYLLKNTTKARVKLGVQGSRAILAYKELTKAAASGENTKIMREIRQLYAGAETDGEKLKSGLLSMLDRIGATSEQYATIQNMDDELLAKMYNTNDMTFEVFFNYEGISKNNGAYVVTEEKRKDIDWFIKEYNKVEMAGLRDVYANDVI